MIWTPDPTAHRAAAVRSRLAALNPQDSYAAEHMPEDTLLAVIRRECKMLGLDLYHTHRSDRSEPGWPDLVISGRGGVLFRELKRENGKTTPDQDRWLTNLSRHGHDVGIWRPSDLVSGRIPLRLAALRSAPTGRTA